MDQDNMRTAQQLATTKYRRLKTLQKKILELSMMCGTSMSLLVKDPKFNKITEYHTSDDININSLVQKMGYGKNDAIATPNTIRICSVNIFDKLSILGNANESQTD